MYISWTPLRELVGAGSNGKIEIDLEQLDRKSKTIGAAATSLSGNSETILHRIEYTSTIRTVPTNAAGLQVKFREFAASVAAGESFIFDASGTEAAPVDPQTVQIVNNSYSETRKGAAHFTYSFQIKE